MKASRRLPESALNDVHPFAVALWGPDHHWATDRQAIALERALDVRSIDVRALDRFLAFAETAALDVAGIGFVLGVVSQMHANRFRFNGMPTPSVKSDAGCPHGFWLPPASLDESAEAVVRERTTADLDADDVLAWARVQVGAWWRVAAALSPGAIVTEIESSGAPVLIEGVRPSLPWSDDPLGDIWETSEPLAATVARCEASYTYSVPSIGPNYYEVKEVDRHCVLPAGPDGRCRLHRDS